MGTRKMSASPSPQELGARIAALNARVEKLEAESEKNGQALERVEDFIEFSFDHARWVLPALSALSSQYDQAARREELGFLHAIVTINEKLGHPTPDDIGNMVLALAGRKGTFDGATPSPPAPASVPGSLLPGGSA